VISFGKLPLALIEPCTDMAVQTVSLALPITYMHFVVMVAPYPLTNEQPT